MNPLFASMAYALSRQLARHQNRPLRDARRVPLWRLLVDEVVYLVQLALRRDALVTWIPAVVVVAAIMVAFADATPGPVIALGWRLATAAAGALIVAVVVRRLARGGNDRRSPGAQHR